MSARRIGIGPRPPRDADAEAWIRDGGESSTGRPRAAGRTVRLTIDIRPELRARIKIAAVGRGTTVAGLLRELFEREYGVQDEDGAS